MNSEFDSSILDEIIEEALSSKSFQRFNGQLGFMETELVSSIFSSLDKKLSNSSFLDILQDSRVHTIPNKNKLKITDLHTVTHNCRKCSFAEVSPNLPKWNVNDPDIVFIFETPNIDQQSSAIFISALKNAGFNSDKVCLTYLLRCPTRSLDQEYIDNCLPYLYTELQIMNPKLIVPVGNLVLSSILNTEVKIKDYKNKITWLGSWPIFPLYSLNYVLKAGESAQQSFLSDIIQAYQFCY